MLKVKENFDYANANFWKLHGTKIRYKNRQHFKTFTVEEQRLI